MWMIHIDCVRKITNNHIVIKILSNKKMIKEEDIGMVTLSFKGEGKASTSIPTEQPIMAMNGSIKRELTNRATENPASVPSIDLALLKE